MKRAALVLVWVLAAVLAWPASAALAHADLVSSDPADGAVLTSAPDPMVLTFSEDVLPETVAISVSDETGMTVRVLSFTVDGPEVVITWPPGMTGREYAVNYRVVSQDGHPISGTIDLTVEAGDGGASADAASPTPESAAPSPTDEAVAATTTSGAEDASSLAPLAAISAGLAVGIAAGALIVFTRRRGRA